jgi:uncharacterized protein YqhQ
VPGVKVPFFLSTIMVFESSNLLISQKHLTFDSETCRESTANVSEQESNIRKRRYLDNLKIDLRYEITCISVIKLFTSRNEFFWSVFVTFWMLDVVMTDLFVTVKAKRNCIINS